MEKKVKDREQTALWYKLFFWYFLIGLILIIFHVVYSKEINLLLINYPSWQKLFNIFISIISILGPSLVVASLFSYSIETKDFINYIIDKVEKVMIKKEFFDRLDNIEKKETMKKLLTPSDEKFKIFSIYKNYLEERITKSMSSLDFPVKSHFSIEVDARIENNMVCFEETIYHRVYKGKNGFDPIEYGLCESDNKFEFISLQFIPRNGKYIQIEKKEMNVTRVEEESGHKWLIYCYNIPKSIETDYISVIIKTKEYGCDHWQMYSYKTIYPSEGMKVKINCDDGLIIKEHLIFDNDKNYICNFSEDKRKIEISTDRWISSGNGINVLVARK